MIDSRLTEKIDRFLNRRNSAWKGSTSYWSDRYQNKGNSGAGSYGRLARFKADFLNSLVAARHYQTVLELGCGDGNQLSLAEYPSYVGVDVAPGAVAACRERFSGQTSKRFILAGEEHLPSCELGLSLDVIYHLVEDQVFEAYMTDLLDHASEAVVLYTSDSDVFRPRRGEPSHIRHRPVQAWMEANRPDWSLVERVPNPFPWRAWSPSSTSFADFYVYGRVPTGDGCVP